MLPSNGTNKKDFQFRSDDMYPEMNIYNLALNRYSEEASGVSRGLRIHFPLNLLQPGSVCTLPAGKRYGFVAFKMTEQSTSMLPIFDLVFKSHRVKGHNVYLFLLFYFFFFLCFSQILSTLSSLSSFSVLVNLAIAATKQHQQQSFWLKALHLQLVQACCTISWSCAYIAVGYLGVPNLTPEPAASVWACLQGCASQWDFRLGFQWNRHFSECSSGILKQHFPGILFMEISGLKLGVIILTQSLNVFIPASGTGNILMNHINV